MPGFLYFNRMDYYEILGVSSTAHTAEIKRAYRRLAVMYHPDKNPSPEAEEIFKLINEAYDVLSDPDKRRVYDSRFETVFEPPVENAQPRHRDPRYRGAGTARTAGGSGRQSIREQMAGYLKYTSAISIFCFSISAVLLIDFSLPTRAAKEKIVKTEIHELRRERWLVLYTNGGHEISVPGDISRAFVIGEEVTVNNSFLLNVARSMENGPTTFRIGRSLYGNFIFAPTALLVLSGLGVALRKNVDYGFNLGVVSFIVLLIMCALLLTI